MNSEDITNYQQSDNYNKVNLWNFVEYSALWTSPNDGNRSQNEFKDITNYQQSDNYNKVNLF